MDICGGIWKTYVDSVTLLDVKMFRACKSAFWKAFTLWIGIQEIDRLYLPTTWSGYYCSGVNKLPFPPVFAGEKLLKNSSHGRITMDLILLTCTIRAIRSNCFPPDESATIASFASGWVTFRYLIITLNKWYHQQIFFTLAKMVQNLSLRATKNYF